LRGEAALEKKKWKAMPIKGGSAGGGGGHGLSGTPGGKKIVERRAKGCERVRLGVRAVVGGGGSADGGLIPNRGMNLLERTEYLFAERTIGLGVISPKEDQSLIKNKEEGLCSLSGGSPSNPEKEVGAREDLSLFREAAKVQEVRPRDSFPETRQYYRGERKLKRVGISLWHPKSNVCLQRVPDA